MEHWMEGNTYGPMPDKAICLAIGGDESDADRVLAIGITDDGLVEFAEQCDAYFGVKAAPEIAIAALEEAIAWIRANTKEPANA